MPAKRVCIVGGVAGGAACAARLRRLDEQAEIFVFERGPDVSFANCGLPYYLGGVIPNRQQLLVATPERMRDWYNIEVRTRHEVRSIDRDAHTIEVSNVVTGATSTKPYDYLVLSPGAVPIRPPIPGVDLPGVFTLRNLEDIDAIRAAVEKRQGGLQAVVVGGGYIGLEMVDNLVRQGVEVTLLERLAQVMPVMDPEMVSPIEEELCVKGVDLRLSTTVTAIERTGDDMLTVTAGTERFTADLVILAVGVRPEVGLAQRAGLDLGETGGIRVDEQMRTSDPAIFAVGDAVEVRDFVTGRPALVPLAGPAARQGRIAADAICGRASRFRGTQGTGIVGVFDYTAALTGASEKSLRRCGLPFEMIYTHSQHHAGYYPGAQMLTIKLLYTPGDGRLLGAQVVGKAGVDKRIDVLAMAIQKGATVADLEEAELAYAPPYGSAKDPVNIAGFAAGNLRSGDVDPVFWTEWRDVHGKGESGPLVIDVRTRLEAAGGGVPGAINIPLGELRTRLDELPRDRPIWVHCGVGQRSYYASRILKQHGFQVRNLVGGLRSYNALPDGS